MVSPIVLGYTQQLEEYLVPELEEEVALVLYVQYNSASTGIALEVLTTPAMPFLILLLLALVPNCAIKKGSLQRVSYSATRKRLPPEPPPQLFFFILPRPLTKILTLFYSSVRFQRRFPLLLLLLYYSFVSLLTWPQFSIFSSNYTGSCLVHKPFLPASCY